MSCSTHTLNTPAVSNEASVGTGGLLKHLWSAFWQRRTERATVAILHGLDDVTLRDIGIGRGEIESIVYGKPAQRRVHYTQH